MIVISFCRRHAQDSEDELDMGVENDDELDTAPAAPTAASRKSAAPAFVSLRGRHDISRRVTGSSRSQGQFSPRPNSRHACADRCSFWVGWLGCANPALVVWTMCFAAGLWSQRSDSVTELGCWGWQLGTLATQKMKNSRAPRCGSVGTFSPASGPLTCSCLCRSSRPMN